MGPYTWWPGFPWMWVFPFTFLIIAIVFLAFLFRGAGPFCWGSRRDEPTRETPRQILDRRYASGEITKEQYEEMKRNLER
ncbi:MAG: SHOCT domain-containing protein [Betaproteobacteria bacterium]|nr:SHOCT domain-containing protein [Betaproteobacteria bacterium]